MFENIEKVIKDCGKIYIEEERYGSGFLAGFDFLRTDNSTIDKDATIVYEGIEVTDTIDIATGPGDMQALHAHNKLTEYSQEHPEFMFANARTLDEIMIELEKRAILWNNLSSSEKSSLLTGFVEFEPTC